MKRGSPVVVLLVYIGTRLQKKLYDWNGSIIRCCMQRDSASVFGLSVDVSFCFKQRARNGSLPASCSKMQRSHTQNVADIYVTSRLQTFVELVYFTVHGSLVYV